LFGWQLKRTDGRERLQTHASIDGINKLLIFSNFLHKFSDSGLIEVDLALVCRITHILPQFTDLLFKLANIAFKDVDFVPAMNINIFHYLCPLLLSSSSSMGHNPFPCVSKTRLALFYPRLSQDALF
jgi:hypothetical protein